MFKIDLFCSFSSTDSCKYASFLQHNLIQLKQASNINFKCMSFEKPENYSGWDYCKIPKPDDLADDKNNIINFIESDYLIICHIDTICAKIGWDLIMIEDLENNGACGCSWGIPKLIPYDYAPNPKFTSLPINSIGTIFVMFQSEAFIKSKINFSAQKKWNGVKYRVCSRPVLPEESKFVNIREGYFIKQDGAYSMPISLGKAGYTTKIYNAIHPFDPAAYLKFPELSDKNTNKSLKRQLKNHTREFHRDKCLMFSHLGKSTRFPTNSDVYRCWKNIVENYYK